MLIDKIIAKLKVSRLRWHDLKSVKPVSTTFGLDRGTPVDRYYIEKFLISNQMHIKGKALEIAESRYSRKFGKNVTSFEVLHIKESAAATILGDLTKIETLPAASIDCFICTQVYNFIFDFQKAIEGTYHLLKPGGIVLATVSGISQLSRYDSDRWGHFWSFYPDGIGNAFKNVFGENSVEVNSYGNSLTAISFIKGVAAEELDEESLDYHDPDYPVTITIVAKKP